MDFLRAYWRTIELQACYKVLMLYQVLYIGNIASSVYDLRILGNLVSNKVEK